MNQHTARDYIRARQIPFDKDQAKTGSHRTPKDESISQISKVLLPAQPPKSLSLCVCVSCRSVRGTAEVLAPLHPHLGEWDPSDPVVRATLPSGRPTRKAQPTPETQRPILTAAKLEPTDAKRKQNDFCVNVPNPPLVGKLES